MWYHGRSVLASIALSINLKVVTFLQAHPSAFYQNRGGVTALLLFQLRLLALRSTEVAHRESHFVRIMVLWCHEFWTQLWLLSAIFCHIDILCWATEKDGEDCILNWPYLLHLFSDTKCVSPSIFLYLFCLKIKK